MPHSISRQPWHLTFCFNNYAKLLALICTWAVIVIPQMFGIGLSFDEMVSMSLATSSIREALFWDNTPPLYYFLLKLWTNIFDSSPESARTMNFLISLIYPLLGYKIALKFFGKKQAQIAVVLFIFSSIHIRYSLEIRAYILFEVLATWNLYFFLLSFRDKKIPAGYWLTLVSLIATHYIAIFLILAQVLIYAAEKKVKVQHRAWVFLLALIFGLIVIDKINYYSLGHLDFDHLSNIFNFAMVEANFLKFLTFGFLIAFLLLYQSPETKHLDWLFAFSLLFLLIAFFAFGKNPFFEKYILFLVPMLLIRLSDFIAKSSRIVGIAFLVGYLMLNFGRSIEQFRKPHSGWEEVAKYISILKDPLILTDERINVHRFYDLGAGVTKSVADWKPEIDVRPNHVILVLRVNSTFLDLKDFGNFRRTDLGIIGANSYDPLRVIHFTKGVE